jgi:DeoR/GlpR family transcriptional regulator of sugar metabolism
MLAVTRLNKIKEIVYEKKSVTVLELAELFKITPETIRRDLKTLEDSGLLKKTYGGAYIEDGVTNEVNFSIKENIMVETKKMIAKKCRSFISNGDSIFLDPSTTSYYICDEITDMRLTVLTNSLKVINKLSEHRDISLISLGGAFFNKSMSFAGRNAVQNLNNYFVDKAFISCEALSIENGITDSNEELSLVRQLAIKRSNETYLLADHTKFDKACFINTNNFENINYIVVDKKLTSDWDIFLEQHQIELVVCE